MYQQCNRFAANAVFGVVSEDGIAARGPLWHVNPGAGRFSTILVDMKG